MPRWVGGARGPDLEIAGCTECLLVGPPARARARAPRSTPRGGSARRRPRRCRALSACASRPGSAPPRGASSSAPCSSSSAAARSRTRAFRRGAARSRGPAQGPARARCGDSASGNLKVTNEKEVPDWPGGGWVGAGPAIEELGMTCLGFYPGPLLLLDVDFRFAPMRLELIMESEQRREYGGCC